MTEYGQVFKFNKEKFKSYELDLQNMVWFQNQDFVRTYLGDNVKYTAVSYTHLCHRADGKLLFKSNYTSK